MDDELLLAVAGSGKTRRIVNEVCSSDKKIAVLTYTISNTDNLRNRIISKHGNIPPNIKLISWFTFLLRHLIKPYHNYVTGVKIKGIFFVQSKSAIKYSFEKNGRKIDVVYKEDGEFDQHYFDKKGNVYSDKLSKLSLRINAKSEEKTIRRLEELFDVIYIDEVQDLASHDLDIIKLLLKSKIVLKMVGDPRQVTYLTHNGGTYKKYKDGKIDQFINDKCRKFKEIVNRKELIGSFRCNEAICNFASLVYPDLEKLESKSESHHEHEGIFRIKPNQVNEYILRYQAVQLRHSKAMIVNENSDVFSFGISKGLTFDHVVIYPTQPYLDWLIDQNSKLESLSRSKLYVAITRARYSVAFVTELDIETLIEWT